jgi:hypothetical protein
MKKKIGDGISTADLMGMNGEELFKMLEEIIDRDNYWDNDDITSDTVLYQQVKIEIIHRLNRLETVQNNY